MSSFMDFFRNSKEKMFVIAGYAGTGKTTIAKIIADMVANDNNGTYYPQFVTFTGKAASVLRAKGCDNCTTIHSMIYSSADKCKKKIEELREEHKRLKYDLSQGKVGGDQYAFENKRIESKLEAEKKNLCQPKFFLNENSDLKTHKLVIVDEYSMLDVRMVEDLLKVCGGKVLFLGDPGQLPPVDKKPYPFKPNIFLDEIHRQALDSPILRAATQVRETGLINLCDWKEFRCVEPSKLQWEDYRDASQLISGKNETVKRYNQKFRDKLGYTSKLPESGEKVMCFKNNHDLFILNGVVYNVTADCEFGEDWEQAMLSIENDDIKYDDLSVWSKRFEYYKIQPEPEIFKKYDQFDFCYAITAHKSQGSEYDNVIIVDDYIFNNRPLDRKRWLYTSITRGAKTVTLVRT